VAAKPDSRRQLIGLGIGPSEAETFWSIFLKSLVKPGLKGVKRVILAMTASLLRQIASCEGPPSFLDLAEVKNKLDARKNSRANRRWMIH
jgi:hypothetical protein